MRAAVIVIAKEPVPGRSKTRLTPPLRPERAAELAAAALHDTLAAVAACRTPRRVLALDGRPGDWIPGGFEVIAQRGDGLDERLASAFEDVGGPALLIGMDTPQVTPSLVAVALGELSRPGTDAVIGPALDGGYWAIGLNKARRDLFEGVPMSTSLTFDLQVARLRAKGLRVQRLVPLRDVDAIDDALAVAKLAPHTRFAATLDAVLPLAA